MKISPDRSRGAVGVGAEGGSAGVRVGSGFRKRTEFADSSVLLGFVSGGIVPVLESAQMAAHFLASRKLHFLLRFERSRCMQV